MFGFLGPNGCGKTTTIRLIFGLIYPTAGYVEVLVFIGVLLIFLLAAMFPHVTERIANWVIDRLVPVRFRDTVRNVTLRFLTGLESLHSPQEALMVFLTSCIIWLLETGKYWFVMHAFPFQVSFFATSVDFTRSSS